MSEARALAAIAELSGEARAALSFLSDATRWQKRLLSLWSEPLQFFVTRAVPRPPSVPRQPWSEQQAEQCEWLRAFGAMADYDALVRFLIDAGVEPVVGRRPWPAADAKRGVVPDYAPLGFGEAAREARAESGGLEGDERGARSSWVWFATTRAGRRHGRRGR